MRIGLSRKVLFLFSHGKKAWFKNHVNDEFVKKAQTYNFRSRASFKLLEIEEKYKVIQKNTNILDLGSAPGSWSQAAQFVNPNAKIAAVDLLPVIHPPSR
jgi:23S rRNA (uridine2552-2'-O)-methyltransferase